MALIRNKFFYYGNSAQACPLMFAHFFGLLAMAECLLIMTQPEEAPKVIL
jgi:hypothetical protein